MTDNDTSTQAFKPLGTFSYPAMPADQSIRRMGLKFWRSFRGKEDEEEAPFVADDSLVGADHDELDELAAPPACGPLLRDLSANFADCMTNTGRSRRIHTLILPPCDRNDVLRTWAMQNQLSILEPPDRDALLNRDDATVELSGRSSCPIVIPRLERWFLRHPSGLHHIRSLLEQLARSDQPFIVGCNSWAWRFLTVAIEANLLLTKAVTCRPFDAARLQSWLAELAISDEATHNVFRLAKSGSTIIGKDADQSVSDNYFSTLAARSLGIPWVAWQKWRRSLRLGQENGETLTDELADSDTVWVAELEEFQLPSHEVDAALLTLQSLLIHDSLTAAELERTTPNIRRSGVIAALLNLGLIRRVQDAYYSTPAAYPAIRQKLAAAGFPVDRI